MPASQAVGCATPGASPYAVPRRTRRRGGVGRGLAGCARPRGVACACSALVGSQDVHCFQRIGQAARRTIQGYEAMHMIRKGRARWVSGSDVRRQIQFIHELFEVAA